MSDDPGPSQTPRRLPLHERSDSQRNVNANAAALTIRVVPYSPPRPIDGDDGEDGEGSGSSSGENDPHPSSPLENIPTHHSSVQGLHTGDSNDSDRSGVGVGAAEGQYASSENWQRQPWAAHEGSNRSNSSKSSSRASVISGQKKTEQQYPLAISEGTAGPTEERAGPARTLGYATGPGSALSSSSSLGLSLAARRDEYVSASPASPSSPVVSSPAYYEASRANIAAVNASSSTSSSVVHHPNQTLSSLSLPSLSPSLSPSPTPQPTQSQQHRQQPYSAAHEDQEECASSQYPSPSLSPSPALLEQTPSEPPSGPTSPLLRPLSRRRNVVAINPESKTFTLVPFGERAASAATVHTASSSYSQPSRSQSQQSTHQQQPHASLSTASEYTEFGARRGFHSGSPPISSSYSTLSTLSTVTATFSLDRPSSGIFSDDHPSSPLTTIPDDRTESPASPKTPTHRIRQAQLQQQRFFDEDSNADTPTQQHPQQQQERTRGQSEEPETSSSSSPWNYRLVGGLRKVPKTPDLKGKGKQRSDEYQSEFDDVEEVAEDSPVSFTTTRSPTAIGYDSPQPLPPLPPVQEVNTPEQPTAPRPRAFNIGTSDNNTLDNSGIGGGNSSESGSGIGEGAGLSFETYFSRRASEKQPQSQPFFDLNTKTSFQSAASTLSERTNYKVYGHSSPAAQRSDEDFNSLLEVPSSSHSENYVLLGESSPAASFNDSLPVPPSSDLDSNENFVIHGDPSPSASIVTLNRALRQATSTDSLIVSRGGARHKFSQESLVIQPLRLPKKKKKSHDNFRLGYYRKHSRESLCTQPSLKSLSSIATQEAARVFFAAPQVININLQDPSVAGPSKRTAKPKAILPGHSASLSDASKKEARSTLPEDPSWAGFSVADASSQVSHKRVRMEPQPHVWSSQLSTVMSESEDGSEVTGSRSPSAFSGSAGGARSSGRRSSGFSFFGGTSTRSRRIGSIESSIAPLDDGSGSGSGGHGRTDSLDRPQAAHMRQSPGPSMRIRDQDEHGDGLADLHDLQSRPSRTGLGNIFRNNSSDRNLHSSASSRNGSFTSSSVPAWARLYYGSGERRLLSMPSISSLAESTGRFDESRPSSGSPGGNSLPIHSPRRRMRDAYQPAVAGPSGLGRSHRPISSEAGSMDISPAMPHPTADPYGRSLGFRRKPSSVWSPHLRFDRHASRYSVWDPPSVQWSAESGPLGRRNAQVILFVTGFLIPLNWIIAAFLPLPPDPKILLRQQMVERGGSTSSLDLPAEIEHTRNGAADETRYQSARWWRTLNRFMAIFGVLIIAAVIVLVVVGVRQKWGQ
ncbi:putative serine-rich protein [Zalerion maritima]|uniref:Serine-rich protein n=1 Tax=Zalerion maritima TaxID=339359 RepID=A0AAD5RNX8_9PEZI|nr:putative serine-rich protein [Zalerion maritima]